MKTSSATFAKATGPRPRAGRSSVRPPSPISAEGFALTGRSKPPDPRFNAFRKDLADIGLAGLVIASHYAEPLKRKLARPAELRSQPGTGCEPLRSLEAGEPFDLLDSSLGWAWGYAGVERRVGYVPAEALCSVS